MDTEASINWKAPYVPYTTLVTFIEKKCGANPLPPRIDKGFLDTYAGSVQVVLLSTLKVMNLINDDGSVREDLRHAVKSPEARKQAFREWATRFYSEQTELAQQNGTGQQLWETFAKSKYVGSTLRKAIVFYLSLAQDIALPVSPHFKAPRQIIASSAKGRTRRDKASTSASDPEDDLEPALVHDDGHRTSVDLGTAGTVTLVVNINPLALTPVQRTWFYKIVDTMEEQRTPSSTEPSDEDEGATS